MNIEEINNILISLNKVDNEVKKLRELFEEHYEELLREEGL